MQAVPLEADDRSAWDRYVESSPNGHILQSWEWGEIKAAGGWEPVRLALRDGDEIRAAAQVLVRSLPYGIGRLAYVPRGPVLDYSDPTTVQEMLAALRDLAAKRRVISLKIEPDVTEPSLVPQRLEELGLVPASPVQMRSSIWVDLTASEETMLARQKQKTRYNTRLAARKGVEVREGTLDDLDTWYDLYETTAQRDQFTVHDRDYYRLVMQMLQPRHMATLLLAYHEGDLLAGIIVFRFGRLAQYMYGASGNQKRNLMAPYLLQWEGMKWAKRLGAETYDLWGIPDQLNEDEDLWGVYRHKRGYGGEIVRYVGAFDLICQPLQHMALERVARPLFKRVSRFSTRTTV